MLTAAGANSGLQNMNFIPKIDICANTMYYPVVRALDNCGAHVSNDPARSDLIGSKGELLFNNAQTWYCLSERLN
jgi:hypothetical protein